MRTMYEGSAKDMRTMCEGCENDQPWETNSMELHLRRESKDELRMTCFSAEG